jgi:UDP-glucose:glycoprotein glucosyltransferase
VCIRAWQNPKLRANDYHRHVDLGDLPEFASLPSFPASPDTIERELVHLTVAADLNTPDGCQQLKEALLFKAQHDNVEVARLNTASGPSDDGFKCEVNFEEYGNQASFRAITQAIGIKGDQTALLMNGRIVGPLTSMLTAEDIDALFSYEKKKRLLPAALAIQDLGLQSEASSPFAFAKISNLIALSQVSDVPEGIFEAAPTVRTDIFKKQWNSTHTAIKVGDMDTANIQIVASIDPASEIAQKWIPIIKVLSELDGVATNVFLNPKDRLEELPIKRFYRYVFDSKPTFGSDGALNGLSARFSGLPADALLNMGMTLPPSWLVAPKESVHDLDNIKLSALKTTADIEATYELEHILIEGHSRDVTLGPPPRGAQLVLQTESDPHFADTIIMANLGYFQFKAGPGIYNLALQKGHSEEIFHIDSAGTLGYNPTPGDNVTEIALMSFRGATLYPRLSRRPGMEDEDVLEAPKSTLEHLAEGADKLLAQVGYVPPSQYPYDHGMNTDIPTPIQPRRTSQQVHRKTPPRPPSQVF